LLKGNFETQVCNLLNKYAFNLLTLSVPHYLRKGKNWTGRFGRFGRVGRIGRVGRFGRFSIFFNNFLFSVFCLL